MSGKTLRRFYSPLRYPGGKVKVANFMKLVFLENDLLGADYVEPYAGGAAVALSLLFEDYADHVHINDIDRSVYAFWRCVLDDSGALCERIERTPVTTDEWQRQREIQDASNPTLLDLGFSTFFLNRTNRSGIINGGMIGGYNQEGPWKLDARYDKLDLIRRIEKVARFRSRISVTNEDAANLLEYWAAAENTRALAYLDPPYYVKGRGLYQNFYRHEHHVDVSNRVRKLRIPWVVSYDAVPEVLELYDGFQALQYSLNYTAQERYQGSEVMFFAADIDVPDVRSPAGVGVIDIDETQRMIHLPG